MWCIDLADQNNERALIYFTANNVSEVLKLLCPVKLAHIFVEIFNWKHIFNDHLLFTHFSGYTFSFWKSLHLSWLLKLINWIIFALAFVSTSKINFLALDYKCNLKTLIIEKFGENFLNIDGNAN